MIERLLFVIVFAVVCFVAYQLFTKQQLRHAGKHASTDPLLIQRKVGIPTIVYFTTPMCAPCKFQQTPTLNQLQIELGENGLQVIRVDATADPAAADRWGVMSVPTTFIVDYTGKPRHVHNGVVSADILKSQIEAISA